MDKKDITVKSVAKSIENTLRIQFNVTPEEATNEHFYKATALLVRSMLTNEYREFYDRSFKQEKKTVYYLCMEFLLGRSLKNNLCNMQIENTVASALSRLGVSIDKV